MTEGIDAISIPAVRAAEFNSRMVDFQFQPAGQRLMARGLRGNASTKPLLSRLKRQGARRANSGGELTTTMWQIDPNVRRKLNQSSMPARNSIQSSIDAAADLLLALKRARG
jgi:hypothetical protein